jgi:tetratricopeptide (TPR) repeat protein
MKLRYILLTAGIAFSAAPADAAITVLGNTFARTCFEAAESRFSNPEAIVNCDQALSEENLLDSDRVATHVNRGILKLRSGAVDSAIADFDQAIDLNPAEAEAYLNKGMAVLRLPDGEDQAIGLFDAALQKKTRKPAIAYYGRAIANELNGRIREAYRDYRQASVMDPKWREPKAELARFTVRQQ